MEESDLLKERVQAITGKHHIQEIIRLKKVELDQEKVKLQHLKKIALREQWLLQDSTSHNATESQKQRQQTRALQLNIHSIEMDILSLEREETRISTNESLILNRLKALDKRPEEIIRQAQLNSAADLFSMETENSLPGQRKVFPADELHEHAGHELYDDGTKCSQQSHDMSCISKLSASEVERLLISAPPHRHHNLGRVGHYLCNHQVYRDRVEGSELSWPVQADHQERGYSRQQQTNGHSSLWEDHHFEGSSHTPCTALYHSPLAGTVAPPLYKEDHSYTILNTLDTTEPITAIFMGFQAAQDDTGPNQEHEGALKAELVIIEDDEGNGEVSAVSTKKSQPQPGTRSYSSQRAASGNVSYAEGLADRWTDRQAAPGIRKTKKHQPCCSVC